ncbi:MAG: c-type cytochrome domain-containing protein [Pseudomonadota bacterium]
MPPHTAGIFAVSLAVTLVACEPKQISYSHDIRPVLDKNCLECHAPGKPGYAASGLSVESYENLMKGTHYAPVIKPGDEVSSTLVLLISGKADESIRMPHDGRKPLDPDEIDNIRHWIKQGAKNN